MHKSWLKERPSRGGGGGGEERRGRRGGGGREVTCSLVPLKKNSAFFLIPQNQNFGFSMFSVPQHCLCFSVPFSFIILFPCSAEINGLIPLFLKTPGSRPQKNVHKYWLAA